MTPDSLRLFSPACHDRVFVILGPYGTGKSEISLNIALLLKAQGRSTALADLDIINPYFRSREQERMLAEKGIRLIAPEGAIRHADLPSVPPGLWTLLQDESLSGVIDLGGDKAGARVLAGWAQQIVQHKPQVWYVFNRARFDNATLNKTVGSLRQLEAQAGLAITGILHNTHLLSETEGDTIREGAKSARELAQACSLPLVAHCVPQRLVDELRDLAPLLPMRLHLLRPWE